MGEYADTQYDIAKNNPAQIGSFQDIHGLGDAGTFALETSGEQLPQLATILIPGGIAGKLGTSVATRAALKAGTATAAQIAERAAMQGVGSYLGAYSMTAPDVFTSVYERHLRQ